MSYSSSFFDNEHVFIWIVTTKSAESEASDAFFSGCLLRCSFNSPFEMLKYEVACVTAPGWTVLSSLPAVSFVLKGNSWASFIKHACGVCHCQLH